MFINPIIITGDRPRADIGTCTDFSIANVSEMVGLCALAEVTVLHFNKVSNLGLCRKLRARSQSGIGPNLAIGPDRRALDMRESTDNGAFANRAVLKYGICFDGGTAGNADMALNQHIDVNRYVFGTIQLSPKVKPAFIREVNPARH